MKDYFFSFMITKFKENGIWTLYNWLNTQNIFIEDPKHPIYIILENQEKVFCKFALDGDYSDFEYLLSNKFIVQNQEEIRDIVSQRYNDTMGLHELNITLMPVNQACNFNCVYCYENHSLNNTMSDYEFEILKKFIERQNPRKLGVDYFGGEPLLNKTFIIKFNTFLKEFSNRNKIILSPSSITTNGYLLDKELFLHIHDLNITSYQITIDGDAEYHNKYRPLTNGEGTYDIIYSNLLDIASTKKHFSITLRMNFNTFTSTPQKRKGFLEKIKNDFKNDKRFVMMVQPIANWKKEDVNSNLYCSEKDGKRLQHEFELEIEEMGLESLSIVLLCGPESHFCYAGKPNNLVIYPRSKELDSLPVQKCTFSISNPKNNVGFITNEGDLVKNANWDKWIPYTLFKEVKCKNCFFVLNCFGNSCSHHNQLEGKIICPKEKNQEIELTKRILNYIERNTI